MGRPFSKFIAKANCKRLMIEEALSLPVRSPISSACRSGGIKFESGLDFFVSFFINGKKKNITNAIHEYMDQIDQFIPLLAYFDSAHHTKK